MKDSFFTAPLQSSLLGFSSSVIRSSAKGFVSEPTAEILAGVGGCATIFLLAPESCGAVLFFGACTAFNYFLEKNRETENNKTPEQRIRESKRVVQTALRTSLRQEETVVGTSMSRSHNSPDCNTVHTSKKKIHKIKRRAKDHGELAHLPNIGISPALTATANSLPNSQDVIATNLLSSGLAGYMGTKAGEVIGDGINSALKTAGTWAGLMGQEVLVAKVGSHQGR